MFSNLRRQNGFVNIGPRIQTFHFYTDTLSKSQTIRKGKMSWKISSKNLDRKILSWLERRVRPWPGLCPIATLIAREKITSLNWKNIFRYKKDSDCTERRISLKVVFHWKSYFTENSINVGMSSLSRSKLRLAKGCILSRFQ